MSKNPSIIHFANVTKNFKDVVAVNDVSIRITPGEIVGFVGPNGAGKTTTLSMLMGFIRASDGIVTLFGDRKITPETAHKTHRRIGFIGGDMDLPNNLTGQQYLRFVRRRFGIDSKYAAHLAEQLKPQLRPKIGNLSRGNKQKIALMAALSHQPDLIVLDEPTSGLDPLMQQTFLSIIRSEAQRGATILMSSHILSEIADVCTRVMFMKQGRIVSDRNINDIYAEAGKLVRLRGNKNTIHEASRHLPTHASISSQADDSLVLLYSATEIKPLLRWLTTRNFIDVEIETRELDDILKDLYRQEGRGSES